MDFEQKYKNTLNDLTIERETKLSLLNEMENLKVHFSELESTNNHLIAATWRERDLKKRLSETLDELNKTKVIVETQNRRITESINYARKIQLAINPTENDLQKHFPESSILYLPKDVISGDFPWIFSVRDYLYVAAVDCTGHGVPGAMMSMIGNLLLNDIVNDGKILLPSEILKYLHAAVIQTLKQDLSDSNSNDGMDVGLCRIDKKNGKLVFSGAHRPLFLLREGQVEIHSGDKFPIGGMHYKGRNCYSDTEISYKKDDAIFLFTDGLPDQVGGNEKGKLMVRNIRKFIEENANLDMPELKRRFFDFYSHWKGSHKQVDDILIMSVRF